MDYSDPTSRTDYRQPSRLGYGKQAQISLDKTRPSHIHRPRQHLRLLYMDSRFDGYQQTFHQTQPHLGAS